MKTHNFENKIFKAYDIRGVVGSEITEETAYFLGLCLGYHSNSNIIVGRDAREHSSMLSNHLINGILDSGVSVINIGTVSSPMCYFAVPTLGLSTAIMITGSHNPPKYNGFKIILNNLNVGKQELSFIIDIAKKGLPINSQTGVCISHSIYQSYIKHATSHLNFGPNKLKIGIDAMNGSGGELLKQLCQVLHFECVIKNSDMSGDFSKILPEPSNPKNTESLKKFLKDERLDFAFSFDGDADRVLMIDKEKVFYGDDITLLLAQIVLPSNQGRKVIFDVKSSFVLETEIKKLGGVPIIFKTGHSLIKKKMKEEDAVLAGEMSGHIYINDGKFFPFDDGIYTFLRIIEYLSHKTITYYTQTFKTPEIKIKAPNREDFMLKFTKLIESKNPSKILTIDGTKAYFGKDSASILARPSNTEDVIIARIEAKEESMFEDLKLLLNNFTY